MPGAHGIAREESRIAASPRAWRRRGGRFMTGSDPSDHPEPAAPSEHTTISPCRRLALGASMFTGASHHDRALGLGGVVPMRFFTRPVRPGPRGRVVEELDRPPSPRPCRTLHRRVPAAAPGAGEHPFDDNAFLAEALADAPRFLAAPRGKVSLRGAVVEPVAGRVAQAGFRRGVADEDHVAAGAQRSPDARFIVRSRGRRDQREGRDEEPAPGPAHPQPRRLAREPSRSPNPPASGTWPFGVSLSTTPGSSSASFEAASPCDRPSFSAMAPSCPEPSASWIWSRRWAGSCRWTPSCRRGCPARFPGTWPAGPRGHRYRGCSPSRARRRATGCRNRSRPS